MRVQDIVKQLGEAHRQLFEELAESHAALAELDIAGLNALQAAQPGELTFVAQPAALKALDQCQASAVILRPEWVAQCPAHIQPWPHPNPALMMAHVSALFALPLRDVEGPEPVIGEGSHIDEKVSLGKGVQIGKAVTLFPGVVIGDGVSIGDRTVLHPNVTVYRDCQIGNDCIIHAGSVIGSDGFGYVADAAGKRVKLHQLGNVVMEDDVEVGANTAIDRATFGTTRIGRGVKIDNGVQIGHNADVGDNTVICGQVGLAGSTTVGKGVTVGAQSGMAGHLKVADGVTFAARSGVTKSIKKSGGIYSGFPAQPHVHWLKEQVSLRRLLAKLGRGEGLD